MFYSLISHTPILVQGLWVLLVSCLLSVFFAPLLIGFSRRKKLGQFIRELGPKTHFSKKGTPTMGGLIFIIPPTIAVLLFLPLNSPGLWIALFSFVSLGFLGFVDDSLKLKEHNHTGTKPLYKIYGQLIVALFAGLGLYFTVGGGIYLPFRDLPLANMGKWIVPWAIFVIVSWANAVNLTDGLDGLAGGLCVIALLPLVVVGLLESHTRQIATSLPPFLGGSTLSLFILSVIGSLFVFLWFNGPPAQIFMGDTGSMALGGLFGTCSLLLKSELTWGFVGILFILESLSVIIQVLYYKWSKGKRFFRMAPLHHHFEQGGMPENKIVLRAWILQVIISLTSLLIILYKGL